MPKVDFSGVEEVTGGGFSQLEPGAYICEITAMEAHPEREYVFIQWDVAAGPCAGFFKGSQYPPRDVMSWKQSALGMAKHKLHVLMDANGGWRSDVAFENDDWQAFVGKRFGAVVRKRLYTNAAGADREGIEIGAWKTPEQIEAGDWKPMEPRDQRAQDAPRTAVAFEEETIPF
jgi:hypothetical protein